MHPSTSLLFSIFFSISLFSAKPEDAAHYGGDGDGGAIPSPTSSSCNNCTICQYPCHSEPPPPSSVGYQPSATPPPPPVTVANCPPPAPVQCCGGQYSYPPPMPYYNQPPAPYYYPYNNYSGLPGPSTKPYDGATWRYAILSCLVLVFILKV